jgi:hypothetical protein
MSFQEIGLDVERQFRVSLIPSSFRKLAEWAQEIWVSSMEEQTDTKPLLSKIFSGLEKLYVVT